MSTCRPTAGMQQYVCIHTEMVWDACFYYNIHVECFADYIVISAVVGKQSAVTRRVKMPSNHYFFL